MGHAGGLDFTGLLTGHPLRIEATGICVYIGWTNTIARMYNVRTHYRQGAGPMSPNAAQSTNKASRFNIRATSDEKQLVEQAASSTHMTTSQFVMQAALRSAEAVLADRARFVLAPEQWDLFVAELNRPARVIPALLDAAAKPSPFNDR